MSADASKLFDAEAERAVAFGLTAVPDCANRELQGLDPSCFVDERARCAIDAFVFHHCAGLPIDALILARWLVSEGRIKEEEASSFVLNCTDPSIRAVPAVIAEHYRRVSGLARQRAALEAVQRADVKLRAGDGLAAIAPDLDQLNAAVANSPDSPAAALRDALSRSVISAADLMTRCLPERTKLLGEWFREGDLGFVFAPRGVGKTWWAFDLACAVSGRGAMGDWHAPYPVKTLYVDGEMPPEQIRERIKGMGGEKCALFVLNHQILFDESERSLNITNQAVQEALTAYCVREAIKVLVLDNLSSLASGMAENDGDEWEKVLAWLLDLRRRGIAVVIVHHAGRNGLMRGTSRREDAAFWIVSLAETKDTGGDPRGARFVSRFTKRRNAQDQIPAIEWHYQTDPTTGEVRRSYKVADNLGILRQMVVDGITSCSDLAEEMGISKGQVSKLAKQAMNAGWLRKVGKDYVFAEQSEGGNERGVK